MPEAMPNAAEEPQDSGEDHLLSSQMDDVVERFEGEAGAQEGEKAEEAEQPPEDRRPSFREMESSFAERGRDVLKNKKFEFDDKVKQEADTFNKTTTSWWTRMKSFFRGAKQWGESEKQIARVKAEMEMLERGYRKKAATIVEDLPNLLNEVLTRSAGVLERTAPAGGPLAELRKAERELSAEYDRLAAIVAEQGANDRAHQRDILKRGKADEAPTEGPGAELNAVYQRLSEVRQRIKEVKENPPAQTTDAEDQRITDGIERALDEAEAENDDEDASKEEPFVLESPLETTAHLQRKHDAESADVVELTEKSKAQRQEEEEAAAWERADKMVGEIEAEEAAKAKKPEGKKKKAAEKKTKKPKKEEDTKKTTASDETDEVEGDIELGPPLNDAEPPVGSELSAPDASTRPPEGTTLADRVDAEMARQEEDEKTEQRARKEAGRESKALESKIEDIGNDDRVMTLEAMAARRDYDLGSVVAAFRAGTETLRAAHGPEEARQALGSLKLFSPDVLVSVPDKNLLRLARKASEHAERMADLADRLNQGFEAARKFAAGDASAKDEMAEIVAEFTEISKQSGKIASQLLTEAAKAAERKEPPTTGPAAETTAGSAPESGTAAKDAGEAAERPPTLELKDPTDPAHMEEIVDLLLARGFQAKDPGPTVKRMKQILLENGYGWKMNQKQEGNFMDAYRKARSAAAKRGGASASKAA